MNDERMIQHGLDEHARYALRYPRRWLNKFGGIKLSFYDAPASLKREFAKKRRQAEEALPQPVHMEVPEITYRFVR